MLIVDRSVDYASVLLSPLTYEALLNEVFENVCGTIDLDERVTKGDHVKLQLTSKDKMFMKIRAQHFTNIFASLGSYAKQLKAQQNKGDSFMSSPNNLIYNMSHLKKIVMSILGSFCTFFQNHVPGF